MVVNKMEENEIINDINKFFEYKEPVFEQAHLKIYNEELPKKFAKNIEKIAIKCGE